MLLVASLAYSQSQNNSCPSGEYPSPNQGCVSDQTGQQYPAGDGCNVVTCMDQACENTSVTTLQCASPNPNKFKPKVQRPLNLNLNLSAHFDSVSVTIYPTGSRMMQGFDSKGALVFTVYRDGHIVLANPEKK